MLIESSAGENIEYESETLLRSYILATFDKYKTVGLVKKENSFEMYSHDVIAVKFAHLLEQIKK